MSLLDDLLCLIALVAVNAAIALILVGAAPDIAAWVAR
jgi:hypothetical protein